MSKKYREITKEETLKLFKPNTQLLISTIIAELNTSRYKVIQMLEDLINDNKIERIRCKNITYNVTTFQYRLKQ